MQKHPHAFLRCDLLGFLGGFAVVWTAYLLLMNAAPIGDGIRSGLSICANVVIPSLFPFMALSGFLALSPVSDVLAKPLSPVTRYLFRLPAETGSVLLLSFIGGYPIGARGISALLEQGRIDEATARRMLCFCINAGPSFVISAIGVSLYRSIKLGAALLLANLLASTLVAVVVSAGVPIPPKSIPQHKSCTASAALVQGVASSANGLIMVCAFVVLFSGLGMYMSTSGLLAELSTICTRSFPLLRQGSTFYNALLLGLLEVTNGCVAAASLGGETAFVLTAFLISFGGISVLFQAAACFQKLPIPLHTLIMGRIANGLLAAAIAHPIYQHLKGELSVMANMEQPIMVATPQSMAAALCIIGMCSILALSVALEQTEKTM